MKLKKTAVALLTAAFTMGCINISAFADVESTDKIIVPVKIDESMKTVNGFIATIEYNPDDITPILAGEDILGDESYAVSNVDKGYLTADKVSEGTIIIGWADGDFYSLEDNNVMANITFEVNPNSSNKTTEINTSLYQIARYSDVIDEDEYFYSDVYELNTNSNSNEEETSNSSVSDIIVSDDTESGSSVELVE